MGWIPAVLQFPAAAKASEQQARESSSSKQRTCRDSGHEVVYGPFALPHLHSFCLSRHWVSCMHSHQQLFGPAQVPACMRSSSALAAAQQQQRTGLLQRAGLLQRSS